MAPEVSDQYQSISEFVAHLLVMRADDEEREKESQREKRQVSVRVPGKVYEQLVALARDVGDTPTGLAAALLELAITEAAGVTIKYGKDGNR